MRAIIIFLTAVVLLSSCASVTSLGVFDESVPEEELAYLEVRNNLIIDRFNDQTVEWKPAYRKNSFTIAVPAGKNTFRAVSRSSGRRKHTSETFEMRPGRTYRMTKTEFNFIFYNLFRIKIKDITSGSSATKTAPTERTQHEFDYL